MEDTLESRMYQRQADVLARRVAGQAILVPIRGELARLNCVFALDPVGEFIWEQLDGRKTLREIAESVRFNFDASYPQAEGDLEEFVSELLAEDLAISAAVGDPIRPEPA